MSDRIMLENRYFRRPILDPKKYKRIIYDPGMVTRIILNRPRYLNAQSHAGLAELEDAFDRASEDPGCNVIVLSGAGSSFCSGDDTVGLTPESAPTLIDGARSPAQLMKEYGSESEVWHQYNIEHDYFVGWMPFHKLRTVPKPTISMVHGYALAMGYMLATNMDIVFASEDAFFGAGGMSGTLCSMIWDLGPRKVLELAFEHRLLPAREAYELGLITRIFPTFEILEKETMAFAYRIADESPIGVRRTKEEYLNTMDHYGLTAAVDAYRTPSATGWRRAAESGHRNRYEGRAMARTPVAFANLKAKLESQGREVPKNVLEAIARAAVRDDKGSWQRALHQEWRDPARMGRADAGLKAYEEWKAEHERIKKEEMARRGL